MGKGKNYVITKCKKHGVISHQRPSCDMCRGIPPIEPLPFGDYEENTETNENESSQHDHEVKSTEQKLREKMKEKKDCGRYIKGKKFRTKISKQNAKNPLAKLMFEPVEYEEAQIKITTVPIEQLQEKKAVEGEIKKPQSNPVIDQPSTSQQCDMSPEAADSASDNEESCGKSEKIENDESSSSVSEISEDDSDDLVGIVNKNLRIGETDLLFESDKNSTNKGNFSNACTQTNDELEVQELPLDSPYHIQNRLKFLHYIMSKINCDHKVCKKMLAEMQYCAIDYWQNKSFENTPTLEENIQNSSSITNEQINAVNQNRIILKQIIISNQDNPNEQRKGIVGEDAKIYWEDKGTDYEFLKNTFQTYIKYTENTISELEKNNFPGVKFDEKEFLNVGEDNNPEN